jgi:PAS domain S-box-containing protein
MKSSLQNIFFQFSSDLYCLIGKDGYFQQVNPAWEELLGWTQAELMAQPWLDLVHPEEVSATQNVYQALVTGEPMQLENRYSHKNGTYRWLAWKILLNEDGWVYGIGRDISEYKLHEQALEQTVRQQATKLRMARQAAKIANHQFQAAQQQLSALQAEFEQRLTAQVQQRIREILISNNIPAELGYTLTYEDLLRSILEHLYPAIPHDVSGTILLLDTRSNPLEEITKEQQPIPPPCKLFVKTHRPLTPELQDEIQQQMLDRLSHLNGQVLSRSALTLHYLNAVDSHSEGSLETLRSLLLVPLINSPYEDNRIIGLLFVAAEPSEQFTEEHIRLLYHVASNTSIAIQQLRSFFITLEKRHLESILANLPDGVLLLNAERRIVLTNPVARDRLRLLAQIDRNNVLQALGNKSLERLIACARDDLIGHEVTSAHYPDLVFEVIVESVMLEFESSYWLVLIRDISDRKRIESEIRKALETEKELSAMKTRLVRTISHEYRTPLATMILAAETLTKHYEQLSRKQLFSTFNKIQNAAKQMAQMVDDILLTNQIESGKFAFHPVQVDIVQLCEQIVENVKILGNHRHRITFFHQGNCSYVCLDVMLVQQILTNLLTNAIKYSPEGGAVRLRLSCGNGKAVFQIEDQGIGIFPKDRTTIFEPFHRGSNVDTIQGTGLGLAIVKKAVELHGGEIRLKTKVGVGTTFTVKLPC